MTTASHNRIPLIDFIKKALDHEGFMEKILEAPDNVTALLKQHIAQKHILLWTVHFSQGRNANITQAFECLTQEPAKNVVIPNIGKRVLEYFERKQAGRGGYARATYGHLPALEVKGGGEHKDYFLIGCIEVVLLKPIEHIFPTRQQQQQQSAEGEESGEKKLVPKREEKEAS